MSLIFVIDIEIEKMKVFVIGIGLIGGSMVLDIKALYPEATVYGIDSNEKHVQQALELGVIDVAANMRKMRNISNVFIMRFWIHISNAHSHCFKQIQGFFL